MDFVKQNFRINIPGVDIARGVLPAGIRSEEIFGRNPEVDTNTDPEDIFEGGGDYTGQPTSTTPQTIEVLSGSANDTSAGTGARTIRVTGLATSTSTAYTTEDVTMNGTTVVTLAGTFYRIIRADILTAGTGQTNAGVITVRNNGATATYAAMPVGTGRTNVFAYTVPSGEDCLITRIRFAITRASGAAGSATIALQRRALGSSAWINERTLDLQTGAGVSIEFTAPLVCSPLDDIKGRVISVSDNDTIVNAAADLVLFPQ